MLGRFSRFVTGALASLLLVGGVVVPASVAWAEPGSVLIDGNFDDGTAQGWTARETSGEGTQGEVVSGDGAAGTSHSLHITGRDNQGDGAIYNATDILESGQKYEFSAYAKFLGTAAGSLTLSSQTDNDTFTNLIEFGNIAAGQWTPISGTFTMPLFDNSAYLYLETPWAGGQPGNTDSFALDQITISAPEQTVTVGDLPALKDTLNNMGAGMAIDSRETTGPASQLLLQQFNQVVAENHMKPEAWFDGVWNFERIGEGSQNMRLHPQARAILQFAAANNLRVFGHVMIWHSQIPDWFFQETPGGDWLSGEPGREELLRRMDNLIYNQAYLISEEFGPFGSPTNPMTAWEVVNEVVSNSNFDMWGLRNSRWAQIIGEDFVEQAFRFADLYVNHEFAAPGSDRPVTLWINDYNTEVLNKRLRYIDLVNRLLEAGVPIDGVGQQFHLQMTTPVINVREALDDFANIPVRQGVTELDITMQQPNPSEDQLDAQGHRFLEIFNVFREHQAAANDLDFVTVWGLTDARSWRGDLTPTLFNGDLSPKPAFWGAVGDLAGLGVLRGTANAFGGAFTADWVRANPNAAFIDPIWGNTPAIELSDGVGDFRVRWNNEGLVLLVEAPAGSDRTEVTFNGRTSTPPFDDAGGVESFTDSSVTDDVSVVPAVTREIIFISDPDIVAGGTAELDVRRFADTTDVGGWNSPGTTGTVTFLEPLSFTQAVVADRAPVFQTDSVGAPGQWAAEGSAGGSSGAAIQQTVREADPIWDTGVAIRTGLTQSGAADGATAEVHTLWYEDTLFVRFDVTDPDIDLSATDPWERDSVEVFLDLGNAKNGEYRPWHDIQIRVDAAGGVTFGTGEPGRQQERLTAVSTHTTDTGYVVELAVGMWTINEHQSRVDYVGMNTFQGFDVQVNDATGGVRTAVHSWANPTADGFQDTSRWGVIELVSEAGPAAPGEPLAPGATAPGTAASPAGGVPWPLIIGLVAGLPALYLLTRYLHRRRVLRQDRV
ncbi:MAG: endo-1,4-beta-xylanase [Cellulomonadaceae bacterium]|nr:endo-1,4-beta-xylanase [Cellulomonadaceae bacterium]